MWDSPGDPKDGGRSPSFFGKSKDRRSRLTRSVQSLSLSPERLFPTETAERRLGGSTDNLRGLENPSSRRLHLSQNHPELATSWIR